MINQLGNPSPDEHRNGCLSRHGARRCRGQHTPATWHACQRAGIQRLRAAPGWVLARRPHGAHRYVAGEPGVSWRACRLIIMMMDMRPLQRRALCPNWHSQRRRARADARASRGHRPAVGIRGTSDGVMLTCACMAGHQWPRW